MPITYNYKIKGESVSYFVNYDSYITEEPLIDLSIITTSLLESDEVRSNGTPIIKAKESPGLIEVSSIHSSTYLNNNFCSGMLLVSNAYETEKKLVLCTVSLEEELSYLSFKKIETLADKICGIYEKNSLTTNEFDFTFRVAKYHAIKEDLDLFKKLRIYK